MIAVLRAPGVLALLLAGFVTRLPVGMIGLALVLQVHAGTGSFAAAGVLAAAFALGLGLTAPVLGRLVDRRGAQRVLVPGTLGAGAALVVLVVLSDAGASPAALVLPAVVAGACTPPTGGLVRRQWPRLLPASDDLAPAYAVDAISLEALFVGGPLLAAGIATVASPAAALLVAAGCSVSGGLALALLLHRHGEPEAVPAGDRAGALRAPGVRWIVGCTVPLGAVFGVFEVMLPAFGDAHGNAALGGPFNAALAIGSAVGGIAYGVLAGRLGARARLYARLCALQAVLCLPLLLGGSVAVMLVAAPIAGLAVAPAMAVRSDLLGRITPPGTMTEAFTWIGLAATMGSTAGAALSGPLVDHAGWRAGAVLAVVCAAATAVLARVSLPVLAGPP